MPTKKIEKYVNNQQDVAISNTRTCFKINKNQLGIWRRITNKNLKAKYDNKKNGKQLNKTKKKQQGMAKNH